ncbi:MAG: hypothetical protein GY859_22805, partial [Desulfobacterales bacterium]|nr:hypothetical protein [Desulfobacterales bacterium]
ERQQEILTAAASWSKAGGSRTLLTTRQPDFNHPRYPVSGSREHIRLLLDGLAATDAVQYFQALMKLPPAPRLDPPERAELVNLFMQVDFHPLSIGLLAEQLKSRTPAQLGERLEALLAESPADAADKSLMASLNLSLDRLDEEARKWLPRLAVFQGGAMEDVLLGVTGLGKTDEDPTIAKGRQLLEAIQSGDPMALLRAAGIELPEGLDVPEELANQLLQTVKEKSKKLDASIADTPQTELAHGADESTWPALRQALETTCLIQAEQLPGVG